MLDQYWICLALQRKSFSHSSPCLSLLPPPHKICINHKYFICFSDPQTTDYADEEIEVTKEQDRTENSLTDKPNQSKGNKDGTDGSLDPQRTDKKEHNVESGSINKPEEGKIMRDTENRSKVSQLNQTMPQKDPDYLEGNGKPKSQNQQDAGGSIMERKVQSKTPENAKNSETGIPWQTLAPKHLNNSDSSSDSKPESKDEQDAMNSFIDIKLEQKQTPKDTNNSSAGKQRQKTGSHKDSDNLKARSDRKLKCTKQRKAESCVIEIKLNQAEVAKIAGKVTRKSKQNGAEKASIIKKLETSKIGPVHEEDSLEDDSDSETESGSDTDSSSEDSFVESKDGGGLRGLRFSDKLALMFRVCEDRKDSKTALKQKSKVCKKANSASCDNKRDKVSQFAETKGTVKKQPFIDTSELSDRNAAQIETVSKKHTSNNNFKDHLRTKSEDNVKSAGDITLELDKISNKSKRSPRISNNIPEKDLDNQTAEESEVHSSDTEIYEYEDGHDEADSVSSFSPNADEFEGYADTDSSFEDGLEDVKDEGDDVKSLNRLSRTCKDEKTTAYSLRQTRTVPKYQADSSSDDETDKIKFASAKCKVQKNKFEDKNEGKSVSKNNGVKGDENAVKSETKRQRHRKKYQNQKIICTVCGKELAFFYARKHMRLHEGKKDHVCDICGKAYVFLDSLKKHIATNHTKLAKKYKYPKILCTVCGKELDFFYVKKHMRLHEGKKEHICDICGKAYVFLDSLKKHIATCHTRLEARLSAPCSICGEQFATNRYMKYHEYHAHKDKFPDVDEKDVPKFTPRLTLPSKDRNCPYCDRKFMFRWQLKAHVRCHTGDSKHRCSTCGKTFENSGNLSRHRRTHQKDNQPFSCSYCPARFTQDSSRKAHERKHTGERPYSCEFCKKTFIQKSNKTTHEKRCKMKPGRSKSGRLKKNSAAVLPVTSKPGVPDTDQQMHQADKHVFSCSFCPAQFAHDSLRKAHEIKHVEERPSFSCDFCMETFTQKSGKTTHEEICKVKFERIASARFEEERMAVLPIAFTPGVPGSLPRELQFSEFF